ncbi:SGNH/GDSL hydrolase family protein [Shewanella phaeophyticola]|uniref:SGNH/GDSL hydrolase family protein n=1 Tax=Shewanella phaeophyticola TaxID=2978345 RepID=A0ABT2P1I2_9GAMM|nr:SGNH/GDSL hydrolase family protein [Shewanella sp. KJ10-1]MCT8986518.1 SGNH/GDSL hydrolase family protein [Shewanella sp. KJ10-1]
MLYHGISIMLAPVLVLQGLKVRRTTPKLPEPEGERVGQTGANPTLNLLILGDSAAAGVGVCNQSEALLGQVIEQLSPTLDVNYALFAKTGATTSTTLEALKQQCTPAHPILGQSTFDVIITSLGVNDITSSVSCDKWLQQQQQFFELIRQLYQPKLILVTALPPLGLFPALPNPLRWSLGQRANQFNERLAQLIHKLNQQDNQTSRFAMIKLPLDNPQPEITMLDFMRQVMASDGFHPGAPIYNAWASLAVEQIVDGVVAPTFV